MEKTKIDISQATPGMRLAESVTNSSGITLMPAGIRLTPMFINRLKKWNVKIIEVNAEKPQPEPVAAQRPRSSATSAVLSVEQEEFARAIATEVSRHFVNVRDNPLMVQLRNVAIKRLIAHGKGGMINVMNRPPQPEGEA